MIHPFGIILILYIIKNTLMKRNIHLNSIFIFLFALLVGLELFINAGYMTKIGNYELLYDEFVLVLLAIVSVFVILKRSNRIKVKIALLFLLMSLIVTEVFLVINPINEVIYRNEEYILPEFSMYSLLVLSKVIIMLIVSVAALQIINKENLYNIMKSVLKYASLIYAVCGVEWITKNVLHSQAYHSVVNFMFGKGLYTVDFLLERGSGYSIQGLMREPSHLAFGLFMFLLILIFSDVDIKTKNKYFIIGLIILIISSSLSGFGYASALMLSYIIHTRKKVKPIVFLSVFSIMLIFIVPRDLIVYYSSRVLNSLNILRDTSSTQMYTSEYVRLFSITETLRTIFLRRPIFGAGLGIPYAYSASIMVLSSIGTVGFIAWFWYYFVSIGKIIISNRKILIVTLMFVTLIFIGSIKVIYSAFILLLVLQMRYFSEQTNTKKRSPIHAEKNIN